MSTPKERVQLEAEALSTKLEDLNKILEQVQPKFISNYQWAMLQVQQVHMQSYLGILNKRLANWEG